ncbi:carboxypeptidase regulatory-like domain-containing protein [Streptomyces sp. NPDC001658]
MNPTPSPRQRPIPDAFVVRTAIVPAVLALLGKAACWLPKWLDRALPDVDVEGEGLRAEAERESADSEVAATVSQPQPQPQRELALVGAGGLRKRASAYAPVASGDPTTAPAGPSTGGQVRGPKGAGVDGATLTLISLSGRQLGRTLARTDGRYTLPTPGAGSYVLIAAADGHRPQAATVVVDEEPVTYDVRLSGTSGLAGTVTDGDGGWPVEGALVVVTDVLATVTSDHEGA